MSIAQAPIRLAYAATEERRRQVSERVVTALAVIVLVVATLYLLIGESPFVRSDIDHSADVSPVNRYVWLSLLNLCLPILWIRRREVAALVLGCWPMLILFAWFALSIGWALDPPAAARRVILYYVLLIVFVSVTVGLRQALRAQRIIGLCAGAVMLVDLLSWPIVPGIAMTPLGFAGMHAQKNVTGEIALICCLTCATYLPYVKTQAVRWMFWGALGVASLILVVSRSTTSLTLGIASLLVLPLLVRVLRGQRGMILVALGGLVLIPSAALFLYLAWTGMTGSDPLEPLYGVTFTERTDLWAFLIENIRQRPLLGAGFGSFWAIDPGIQPSILSGLWFGQGTEIANQGHNAYLDIGATTGLTGLVLLLVVVARAIWQAGREVARGASPYQLGFMLVIAVHSVTESSLFTANSVFGSFFVLTAIQVEWARLRRM